MMRRVRITEKEERIQEGKGRGERSGEGSFREHGLFHCYLRTIVSDRMV